MKENKILKDYFNTITYSENHIKILNQKRDKAKNLLEIFAQEGIDLFLFGSVARGDVHSDSDIDLVLLQTIAPYQIEIILDRYGIKNYFREIIMATPTDTLKLYIYLNELVTIVIPLSKFDRKSKEFYDFGGKISISQLRNNLRVPGIDKRLILIRPTPEGYEEYSIIGNEHLAAKEVNIGIDLLNERKYILLKREKIGKTGVFLKRTIEMNESTEEVLKKLSYKKSIVRKKLFKT